MKTLYLCFILPVLNVLTVSALSAEDVSGTKKEEEQVQLDPFTHEYYWSSFTVTKDTPVSSDGRYRLKQVARNGSVELIFSSSPTESEVIVVKPALKKPGKCSRVQTIVVVESDAKAQTATIKELRMR